MFKLDAETLITPYNPDVFKSQLIDVGIPIGSIKKIENSHPFDNSDETLLSWLYQDIEKDETVIENGERYIRLIAIYCTDGFDVLVERNQYLGTLGAEYQLGGLISSKDEPKVGAIRELREETPLDVDPENIIYIGYKENESYSSKLPGVVTYREIDFFKYLEHDRFKDIPEIYYGNDGEIHELLLIPIDEILTDMRVNPHFQELIRDFINEL